MPQNALIRRRHEKEETQRETKTRLFGFISAGYYPFGTHTLFIDVIAIIVVVEVIIKIRKE